MIKSRFSDYLKREINSLTQLKLPDFSGHWAQYLKLTIIFWFVVLRFTNPNGNLESGQLFLAASVVLLIDPIRKLRAGNRNLASWLGFTITSQGNYALGSISFYLDTIVLLVFSIVASSMAELNLWISPAGISLILVFAILTARSKVTNTQKKIGETSKGRGWLMVLLICKLTLYSYSALYGANSFFDLSEPQAFNVLVLDKRVVVGGLPRQTKSIYYIKLALGNGQKKVQEFQISRERYEKTVRGKKIVIHARKGLFRIPWFQIPQIM